MDTESTPRLWLFLGPEKKVAAEAQSSTRGQKTENIGACRLSTNSIATGTGRSN